MSALSAHGPCRGRTVAVVVVLVPHASSTLKASRAQGSVSWTRKEAQCATTLSTCHTCIRTSPAVAASHELRVTSIDYDWQTRPDGMATRSSRRVQRGKTERRRPGRVTNSHRTRDASWGLCEHVCTRHATLWMQPRECLFDLVRVQSPCTTRNRRSNEQASFPRQMR